ncbi:uncharacterized protein LOC142337194 isoform X1 [Convolutriloba macropyga]|uniref:uncharacterized protein LOC142337194 isoform X1 n=1 Tax=Convolutriloba macropyga TaxID=536237 RepID=UPI003F51F426
MIMTLEYENATRADYSKTFAAADAILSLSSIIPNYICLFHIFRQLKREKVIKYYLYFSLVITTCITSSVGNHIYLVTKTIGLPDLFNTNQANYNFCVLLVGIYLCANAVLPSTLVCLSVEQLYAIHHPTKTHKRTPANTIKAASLYLVISWANGVVNGWYLLVFQNKQLIDGNTFARCYFEDLLTNHMLAVYLICNFYIPLALLLTSNSMIYHRMRILDTFNTSRTSFGPNSYTASTSTVHLYINMSANSRSQYRSSLNSLVVLSTFCLASWSPLMIIRTAEIFDNYFERNIPGPVLSASVVLWHSSALFNPLYILFKEHRSGNFKLSGICRPPCRKISTA